MFPFDQPLAAVLGLIVIAVCYVVFGITGFGASLMTVPILSHFYPVPFVLALFAIADRASALVREYEAQGYHRTATAVDTASGEWLAEQVRRAGLTPVLEPFRINRVDLVSTVVILGDRRLEAVPLFDGAFTDASGVRGRLGRVADGTPIALSETATNAAGSGALGVGGERAGSGKNERCCGRQKCIFHRDPHLIPVRADRPVTEWSALAGWLGGKFSSSFCRD